MTVSKIYESFNKKDYELTIYNINEYLSQPNARIRDDVMLKYIYSLIFLGRLEEAYEKTNEIKINHPEWLSNYKTASIYIQCGKLDEAKEILKFINPNKYQAFSIGKQFYFYGLHKEAKNYFILARQMAGDDQELRQHCDFFMNNIKKEKMGEAFMEMNYDIFSLYRKLKPGHIILAKNSTEADSNNASSRGLYIIWKNTPDSILSFPLSSTIDEEHRVREKAFIIDAKTHPHLRRDRRIKNITVPINEEDIDKVVGKLSIEEYKTAVHNIYKKFVFISTDEHRLKNKDFIKFFRETVIQIKPNDFILVVNRDNGQLDSYKVLDYDENSCVYTARELIYDNDDYYDTDNIVQLGIESRILDSIKFPLEKTNGEKPKQKKLDIDNR